VSTATIHPARRRDPVQERSHETVSRVVAAAGRLLARGVSVQGLTTTQIAAEAGLSVGALYRFFPDKQAVVDAIAMRHLEVFQEQLAAGLMAAVPDSPAGFLAAVVDGFAGYLEAHADFRMIAYGQSGGGAAHCQSGGRAISMALFEQQAGGGEIAGMVRAFLSMMFGIEADEAFDFRLRLAVEIGDRLIAHAFAHGDPALRARVLSEAKRLLAEYLFD